MNDETVMLKDLSPGDEFRRFSGKHRYVVSSQREEYCGNVKIYCYNLTSGNSYEWGGGKRVVPLKRSKGDKAMNEGFKEVIRIPVCLRIGKKYQVEIQGNDVVISKETERVPEWEDITKSCHLEFRHSCHCDGRYIAVMHIEHLGKEGKVAAIIGLAGIHAQKGFKVEKPCGAFTSFRVLKKNK